MCLVSATLKYAIERDFGSHVEYQEAVTNHLMSTVEIALQEKRTKLI